MPLRGLLLGRNKGEVMPVGNSREDIWERRFLGSANSLPRFYKTRVREELPSFHKHQLGIQSAILLPPGSQQDEIKLELSTLILDISFL